MLAKKKVPTFEERLQGAYTAADAATSVLDTIVSDLTQAAVEKAALLSDIDAEIARLSEVIGGLHALALDAESGQDADLKKANQIRALLSA